MAETGLTQDALKQAMKGALAETLVEQRDLLRGVFYEVLEDVALSEAIREGEETELADLEQVVRDVVAPEKDLGHADRNST